MWWTSDACSAGAPQCITEARENSKTSSPSHVFYAPIRNGSPSLCAGGGLLLEAYAEPAVCVDAWTGSGRTSAPLVSSAGPRVACGPPAALGSVRLGRTAAVRTGPAGGGLCTQLAVIL